MYNSSEIKESLNLALNTIVNRFNPPTEDIISMVGSSLISLIEHNIPIEERRKFVKQICKGIKDNVTTL